MNLLILGAGEYGRLVKEMFKDSFDKIDFLDDNSYAAIGKISKFRELVNDYEYAIVAIGNNELRARFIYELKEVGYKIPKLISDKAYVSPSAIIEGGVIIEPMAVIHNNARIEEGTIISSGAIINHDAIVKPACHIDCNAIVGAHAMVAEKTHLNYGQVIYRTNK